VTPPVRSLLAGHGWRVSEGLHDPLFAKVLYFSSGRDEFALVTTDLLGFDLGWVRRVRALAKEYAGLRPGRLILTASHTHSGPHLRTLHDNPIDPAYAQQAAEKIAGAIYEAKRKLAPATAGFARGTLRESVNRRVNMPDGKHYYLPKNVHLMEYATGVTDPEVGVVSLRTPKGEPVATLVNYAAHAICVGIASPFISADYPGVMMRVIEEKLGGLALFSNGACGDVHPKGFESGHARAEAMGRALAGEALRVEKTIRHSARVRFATARRRVSLPIRTDVVREKDKLLVPRKDLDGAVPYAKRFLAMKTWDTEMIAFALDGVAFVGVPGELLVEIGLAIKARSPFKATYVLYNSNDYAGYIPPAHVYAEGGYEEATLFPAAAGRLIERTAVAMLRKIHA
jgi:hypothetical protein